MSTELVLHQEAPLPIIRSAPNQALDDVQRLGNMLAASGYFSDVTDVAQAAVKVMAGQELGIPPVAAMMGINIIKGKVALGAHLIASRVRAHGYDFRIKEHTDNGCAIEFFTKAVSGKRESLGTSSFGKADALAAKISSDMYQKYPRNMYYSRAMSNGAKWFTPDVFGGAPIYTPEELGAEVNGEGDIVNPSERGSVAAANQVRDQKLAEAGVDLPPPEIKESKVRKVKEAPKVSFEMLQVFTGMKEELGEEAYRAILKEHGWASSKDIPSKEASGPVYKALAAAVNDKKIAEQEAAVLQEQV